MTIKLPAAQNWKESLRPSIGTVSIILSACLGSVLGRWAFHTSESAWENAYIAGFTLGFLLEVMVIRKGKRWNRGPALSPNWLYASVIVASLVFCAIFKAI